MRRLVMAVLSFSLLGCFSVLGSTDARAQAQSDEVVILLCVQNPGTSPPSMVVRSATSSQGAPTFNRGDSCAQALADLRANRFDIEGVEPAFNAAVIYTLDSFED